MPRYTFDVVKRVSVTVEADNESAARERVTDDLSSGMYEALFDHTAPTLHMTSEGVFVERRKIPYVPRRKTPRHAHNRSHTRIHTALEK
jgi:hypothetical protein